MSTVLDTALELHAAGMVAIPLARDTKKRPAVAWKVFQTEHPTQDELRLWFDRHHRIVNHASGLAFTGLGLVTGSISGNLVMIECEGRATSEFLGLAELAANSGLGELWSRFLGTWTERSPSGGVHWFLHLDLPEGIAMPGNTKLARRPAPTAADPHGVDVLAETRGEAGYTVLSPTPGAYHASGTGWARVYGAPATAVTLSWEDYQALVTLIGTLDEMPPAAPYVVGEAGPDLFVDPSAAFLSGPDSLDAAAGDLTPGDDFERQTDWSSILDGWTCVRAEASGYREWVRPGKDPREGLSATTGRDPGRDRLWVFSSSTGLPTDTSLTKFYAYALLHFGGDAAEAARELRRQGFGTDRPVRKAASPERNAQLAQQQSAARLELVHGRRADQGGQEVPAPGTDGSLALSGPALAAAVAAAVPPPPLGRSVTPKKHNTSLTDSGNAQMLSAAHGHRLRYVVERGQWIVWDAPGHPGRWLPDPAGTVVLELMRTTLLEAELADPDAREHRAHSLSRRALADAVTVARGLPGIVVASAALDADPYALGTPGGLVDLRTGLLSPADPAALVTRCTLMTPDAGVGIPRWLAFLHRMFDGDGEVIGYVQRLMGYFLSGLTSWHVLPFLHGPGANGKSVLAGVLRRLMGDYASAAPANFLMAGLAQHSTELAMLEGLRFLVASEIDQRARFDESKVKMLTGGDAITARHMRQDFYTFTPTHKLALLGNHLPRVEVGGESFWRRLRLLNCGTVVPESERIPDLDVVLVHDEGPGILAWAMAGFRDVMAAGGLQDPASVLTSTQQYAAEESGFDTFVSERLVIGGGASVRVETGVLRAAYTSWCLEEGLEPVGAITLGRDLARLGVTRVASNNRKWYANVSLVTEGPSWST